MRHYYIILLVFIVHTFCISCNYLPAQAETKDIVEELTVEHIYDSASIWVDSVYSSLSEEQKIAQLFWLAVEQPYGSTSFETIKSLVERYQPGGILLFKMTPQEADLTIDTLQSISKVPLFVSIDAEWGLGMRITGATNFPYAMTLGAIRNDSLVYQMGFEIARQLRSLGINVNMAPVADINSNPDNPVIGIRSFGELTANVASKSLAYMKGLQDGGVMAVGKHFPGHGDTSSDSHKTMPIVSHSATLLDTTDLVPFKAMIEAGLWGVMTAHIGLPALDSRKGIPASFSDSIVKNLLKDNLGFRGLVITDALNMQGAKTMGTPGIVDALALAAGNDIVEFTEDINAGIRAVQSAIEDSIISLYDVEDKCRRSLSFKYWLTQHHTQIEVDKTKLDSILNISDTSELNQQLYDAALTVLINDSILPVNEEQNDISCIILGNAPLIAAEMEKQGKNVYILPTSNDLVFDRVLEGVEPSNAYIFIIADSQWGRRRINSSRREQLIHLACNTPTISVFMGNPYHLSSWRSLEKSSALVLSYQNSIQAQQSVIRLLNGEIGANGRLPVSIRNWFEAGRGEIVIKK